jgi:hypothetical protein
VLLTVGDSADSEAILGNKSFDGSQLLGRGDLFFNGDRLIYHNRHKHWNREFSITPALPRSKNNALGGKLIHQSRNKI